MTNSECRMTKESDICGKHRSTAKSMSESIDHSWTCREDSGIERNQSSKKTTVTHNSVFAAHRLQCRMTIPKIDIRHFVLESIEATAFYRPVRAASTKRSDYSFRRSINGE